MAALVTKKSFVEFMFSPLFENTFHQDWIIIPIAFKEDAAFSDLKGFVEGYSSVFIENCDVAVKLNFTGYRQVRVSLRFLNTVYEIGGIDFETRDFTERKDQAVKMALAQSFFEELNEMLNKTLKDFVETAKHLMNASKI